MSKTIYYQGPVLELPWANATQEQSQFKRLSIGFIVLFLIVSVVIPMIPVPELAREEQEKLPDNLARLLIEEPVDIPEPVIEEPVPVEPEPVVEEEPEVVEPEVPPEPIEPEIVEPEPEPPAEVIEEARQRASVSGLLQFQDDLQQMREMVDVEALSTADLRNSSSEETVVQRDLLSSGAQAESGGIAVSDISVNAGGIAVSGRESTYVDSSLALPGGVGSEALYQDEPETAAGGGLPPRSEEETRRVMDANKSAIFAIYNRALRSDPTLEGKFLVEMVVEPDGFISSVNLISSQLDDPELEQRLLTRIQLIQFPAGNYATTTVNQTFDFLPY